MLLIKAKKRKPENRRQNETFSLADASPSKFGTLVLPACDKAQNEPAPRSESAPNIGTTKTSDADLEKAVRAMLESDDAIKRANLSVSADVEANKATLSGMVVSQDLRNKAINLAQSAQPGLTIGDKIDVKPAG